MKNLLNKNFYILLSIGLLLACCKKDDDAPKECNDPVNPACENYDPCWGVEEPTAKIQMRESYLRSGFGWQWAPYDTVFVNEVEFSSPYIGDEYTHTWYLGAEVIHEPLFTRTHAIQRPAFITVSHVLTFPVDSACYGNSTGKDSVSATYYLIEFLNELKIRSKFRGVFENQIDSFDFEFKFVYQDNSPVAIPVDFIAEPLRVGINFHNEGDSGYVMVEGLNLEGYFGGDGYLTPKGTIEIDPVDRKIARFEYEYLLEDHIINARILE